MAENNAIPNEINNENDKFFKGMMSLQIVVKDYIQQFVPKNILDKLDLDTLELDSNSYITDELSEFFSDMVWQCRYKKSGRRAKVSFLHEHKSYKPKYPHFQLYQIRSFTRMITVYLASLSEMSGGEIKEKFNKSNNVLKSEAMTIIDEFVLEGEIKGIEKEKQNTIIRSWQNGIAVSMISNITGLPIAEVEKVIADFQKIATT